MRQLAGSSTESGVTGPGGGSGGSTMSNVRASPPGSASSSSTRPVRMWTKRAATASPSRCRPVSVSVSPMRIAGCASGGATLSSAGYGGTSDATARMPRSLPVTGSAGPRVSTGSAEATGSRASISTTLAMYAAHGRYLAWSAVHSFDSSSVPSGS